MNSLKGKRVAVTADRRASEIGSLIENFGGAPVFTPIQGRKLLHENQSRQDVLALLELDVSWVVLTTGIGIRALEDAARAEGVRDSFLKKMKETKLALRGQKTLDWVNENKLTAEVVAEDGTMEALKRKIEEEDGSLFLQAYSVDDAAWKETFERAGHDVYLSSPYEYEPPEERVMDELKREITDNTVAAVTFTSKTQVRNLFAETPPHPGLIASLNEEVKAVATGKVTAQELRAFGVEEVLQPENQKMGAMIVEMARHFERTMKRGEPENV